MARQVCFATTPISAPQSQKARTEYRGDMERDSIARPQAPERCCSPLSSDVTNPENREITTIPKPPTRSPHDRSTAHKEFQTNRLMPRAPRRQRRPRLFLEQTQVSNNHVVVVRRRTFAPPPRENMHLGGASSGLVLADPSAARLRVGELPQHLFTSTGSRVVLRRNSTPHSVRF
jgi:hypothetical protein